MIKAFIWFIYRIIEQVNKFLFGSLVLIVLFFSYSSIMKYIKINFRDNSCKTYYPIKEEYMRYSKDHYWKIEQMDIFWRILSSYKNNKVEDGLSISFSKEHNSISDTNETYISISSVENGKETGLTLSYIDSTLSKIQQMKLARKEGIKIEFYKNMMPSMVLVYKEDKLIGEIWFWDDGSIREIEFDAKHKFKKTWESIKYSNGRKAYLEKKENGLDYRIIYNTNGEVLLKFPINNDPCKIQLYEQGKKVNIPLYLDVEEVIDIFNIEKLK